jgi:hypothetical protein
MNRAVTPLLTLLTVPLLTSCLPTGGGFGGGPGVDFRLNELTPLGLSPEQTARLEELEQRCRTDMTRLSEGFGKMVRAGRPSPEEAGRFRDEMNLLLDETWFRMRCVLTEEQLHHLQVTDPTHPLVQDEAPRFTGPALGPGGRGGPVPGGGGGV